MADNLFDQALEWLGDPECDPRVWGTSDTDNRLEWLKRQGKPLIPGVDYTVGGARIEEPIEVEDPDGGNVHIFSDGGYLPEVRVTWDE